MEFADRETCRLTGLETDQSGRREAEPDPPRYPTGTHSKPIETEVGIEYAADRLVVARLGERGGQQLLEVDVERRASNRHVPEARAGEDSLKFVDSEGPHVRRVA